MTKKNRTVAILILVLLTGMLSSCGSKETQSPLDPDKPVTITIWHYYNGHIKDKFDALVNEFNETVGMEKGIAVDALSQGDVGQLADAVFASANQAMGADPLPDIFAAYPDNAIRIHEISGLVSLETYFTADELSQYRPEFLEEGRFGRDKKSYIMPIAKSFETLFVNKKAWEAFASSRDYTTQDLQTWEGLSQVSSDYYEETGKSFFSLDANANYMLLASIQLGTELYSYQEDGSARLELKEEVARKIWDYYYVPYLKGYFSKSGRFSSDDAKTGKVLTYTGSTAGSAYFPTEVTLSGTEVVQTDPLVLPYPYFKDGEPYVIQQGAGMCITGSDPAHEFGAAEFLKWFTQPEQNIQFAVSTGYFPVNKETLEAGLLLEALEKTDQKNPAIGQAIMTTVNMLESYSLYNNKPFSGSYEMRNLLESHLSGKIKKDLEQLQKEIDGGEDKDIVLDRMCSSDEFEKWFADIKAEGNRILSR